MADIIFEGFKQVDGTAPDFDEKDFENGYIYFVRTSEDKEEGYIWFNGKKYGQQEHIIDCGTY